MSKSNRTIWSSNHKFASNKEFLLIPMSNHFQEICIFPSSQMYSLVQLFFDLFCRLLAILCNSDSHLVKELLSRLQLICMWIFYDIWYCWWKVTEIKQASCDLVIWFESTAIKIWADSWELEDSDLIRWCFECINSESDWQIQVNYYRLDQVSLQDGFHPSLHGIFHYELECL